MLEPDIPRLAITKTENTNSCRQRSVPRLPPGNYRTSGNAVWPLAPHPKHFTFSMELVALDPSTSPYL